MSDVVTTQRAVDLAERTQAKLLQARHESGVISAQAIFPNDRVDLSPSAQKVVSGDETQSANLAAGSTPAFRDAVVSGAASGIAAITQQLDHLMTLYGVGSDLTNIAGQKVSQALRAEVKSIAGTVEPPAIDMQVRQALNLVVKELTVTLPDPGEDANGVTVDYAKVDFQYSFKDAAGSLLTPAGATGTDENGNAVDLSQAGQGVFFAPFGSSSQSASDSQVSAFDRFTSRSSDTPRADPQADAAAATRPDVNQDGARNDADRGALVVVQGNSPRTRQAETGVAQFIADVAVPIALRSSEATPSRSNSRDEKR